MSMKHGPDIARLAALIGDPARANMLTALLDGRALTASELASVAGVTPQTASSHLGKMLEGHLLQQRKQGRHRYYALADEDVAAVLEGLMGLAAGTGAMRVRPGPKDAEMRVARICYHHLAGQKGVQMYRSLIRTAMLAEDGERVNLTEHGAAFVREFGVDLDGLQAGRSTLCRSCLDWSERRSHLAGSLGRAMLARMEVLGWVKRQESGRLVRFTRAGMSAFDQHFPAPQ